MPKKKESNQSAVWFNPSVIARYRALKLKTPFREKVKTLVNNYLEGMEHYKMSNHTSVESIGKSGGKSVDLSPSLTSEKKQGDFDD